MFASLDERVEAEISCGIVSDVCFGVGAKEDVRLFSSRSNLAIASPVFNTMFFGAHWHSEGFAGNGPYRQQVTAMDSPFSGSPSRKATEELSEEYGCVEKVQGAAAYGRAVSSTSSPDGKSEFIIGQHHYVAVTDVEPSALRCMLRYVHHLDPQLTLDNALHVFRAADKYQMDGLLGACAAFIDANADPYNVKQVLRLFDIACRLGLEKYSQGFLQTLGGLSQVQTRQVLRAEEFFALHSVSLATLLNSEGLCVEEERLWHALRSWAEIRSPATRLQQGHSPESSPEDSTAQTLTSLASNELVPTWQDALRPLKHLIRFPVMSAKFFADEVAKTEVVSYKEVVEVFGYMAQSNVPKCPQQISAASDVLLLMDAQEAQEELVAGVFRTRPRTPELAWCLAPAATDPDLCEELGITEGLGLLRTVGSVVVDGRGLSPSPWGSSIVLAGPGTGFHLAFGNLGFSCGIHAWTISWRPMDSLLPGRSRGSRGGAAGIARQAEAPSERASMPVASALGPGVTGQSTTAQKSGAGVTLHQSGSRSGGLGAPWNSGAGTEDPSVQFLDWPSCIVFGVKRDVVSERRYVAWEEDLSASDVIRFSIVLDMTNKTLTYVADRGERCWTGSFSHDGPVYPVVAASGPHYFHIEYGGHV